MAASSLRRWPIEPTPEASDPRRSARAIRPHRCRWRERPAHTGPSPAHAAKPRHPLPCPHARAMLCRQSIARPPTAHHPTAPASRGSRSWRSLATEDGIWAGASHRRARPWSSGWLLETGPRLLSPVTKAAASAPAGARVRFAIPPGWVVGFGRAPASIRWCICAVATRAGFVSRRGRGWVRSCPSGNSFVHFRLVGVLGFASSWVYMTPRGGFVCADARNRSCRKREYRTLGRGGRSGSFRAGASCRGHGQAVRLIGSWT